MTYNNYSISSGKGKLYLKSKTPQEGFEEVLYGTGEVKDKTYHQYHNSIKGIPKYLEVKEIQYQGRTLKFLELSLIDGDVSNKISTALKNKNGYTDEVKALISALNGLELGEEVTLSTVKSKYTNKLGVEKENLNIYINYTGRLGDNGKGLGTGFIPFSDIPKAEKEVDEDDGEVTWNWKPVNKFFTAKIKELEERFKSDTTSTPQASAPAKQEPAPYKGKVEMSAPTPDKAGFDQLPF
jgi:hypothetical protein